MNATAHFAAGRLVMVDVKGTHLDSAQAEFLRRNQIRAVCLFRSNIGGADELRQLTHDLREVMGEHALIAIDQEGGSVIRATFLPQPPASMALGAANDLSLSEAVGAATARGLRAFGINWNFAPVVDINNNPANPVIAERSYSSSAGQVTAHAAAWMRGSLNEGVACCIKHFPGHGDTNVDSHFDLPVVDKPVAALEALEFAPFKALAATAPAMMTAHIVYPALDPDHPATLSQKVLGGLLRQQIGYNGVVITDSLVMKAIHDRYGHHKAAVMALQAGADMVMALGSHADQEAALQAISGAIAAGTLEAVGLQRADARVNALAERFPVSPGSYSAAQHAADDAIMRRAWAAGLTELNQPQRPPRERTVRVVTQRDVPTNGVSEAGLSGADVSALFAGWNCVEFVMADDLPGFDWASLPADGSFTVLASNHRRRYPNSAAWRPDLHLALWNPFQVLDVAAPALVTWGYGAGALAAVGRWLNCEAQATGTCPVDLGRG